MSEGTIVIHDRSPLPHNVRELIETRIGELEEQIADLEKDRERALDAANDANAQAGELKGLVAQLKNGLGAIERGLTT